MESLYQTNLYSSGPAPYPYGDQQFFRRPSYPAAPYDNHGDMSHGYAATSNAPGWSVPTSSSSPQSFTSWHLPPPASLTATSLGLGNFRRTTGYMTPHHHHHPPAPVAASIQRPRLTTTVWEDEGTICYQVDAKNICVARRQDNDMINGTKLLNVVGMSRGKRDGILKNEKGRVVVKVGAMHLKGVWIDFKRAKDLATKFKIIDLLYPLFTPDPSKFLVTQNNNAATNNNDLTSLPLNDSASVETANTSSNLRPQPSVAAATTSAAAPTYKADPYPLMSPWGSNRSYQSLPALGSNDSIFRSQENMMGNNTQNDLCMFGPSQYDGYRPSSRSMGGSYAPSSPYSLSSNNFTSAAPSSSSASILTDDCSRYSIRCEDDLLSSIGKPRLPASPPLHGSERKALPSPTGRQQSFSPSEKEAMTPYTHHTASPKPSVNDLECLSQDNTGSSRKRAAEEDQDPVPEQKATASGLRVKRVKSA